MALFHAFGSEIKFKGSKCISNEIFNDSFKVREPLEDLSDPLARKLFLHLKEDI